MVLLIAQLSRERDLSGAPSPDTPAAQSNVEPQEQNALGVRFLHLPPDIDQSCFAQEQLHEVVQQEPATARDPELMGPLAAIGIIKGKPFAPDARMKKILTEVTLANATSRSLLVEAA